MRNSLRLGKIMGITINLHYSWFLIFAVFTYFFTQSFLQDYTFWVRLIAGLGISIFLFGSVLFHELSHSFIAIRNGIPVKSITLFILGGVANISKEATRPMTELKMAIAGPVSSLLLAVVFGLIWFLTKSTTQDTIDFNNPVFWLAWSNFALAIFNLIPGFPLDGGRVLRAILWQFTGNYRRATRIASLTGKGLASLFIAGGVVILFSSFFFTEVINDSFDGIYLIFLGWFLFTAANTSYKQVEMREALRGLTARAIMNTSYVTIPPGTSLRELVQSYVLPTGNHYFVVAWEGRLKGIITLDNIKSVPQSEWVITPASAAMTPIDKLGTAQPEDEALSLLDRMEGNNIGELPVVKDGAILGIIIRQNLFHFIQLRSKVGSPSAT